MPAHYTDVNVEVRSSTEREYEVREFDGGLEGRGGASSVSDIAGSVSAVAGTVNDVAGMITNVVGKIKAGMAADKNVWYYSHIAY